MKFIKLGKSELKVPAIAVGCMRMLDLDVAGAENFVNTALELGVNFFDHADIYGGGGCEELFGKVLAANPGLREQMLVQSKCGIVPGKMYDFSKEYILESVDGCLKRLHTDYLDVLVLHRPDALMEPEEVAEAFDALVQSGKVRHFGVSNQNPYQMQLLAKYIHQDILVDQLQLSLTNSSMISLGMEVNMESGGAVNRDGGVLDFCRLNDITIQTWSPFQYGMFEGTFIGSDKYPELNVQLNALAEKYNTSVTAVVTAWILRHPANMQMIAGSMKVSRLKEVCSACEFELTREEWYRLYLAAGHILP